MASRLTNFPKIAPIPINPEAHRMLQQLSAEMGIPDAVIVRMLLSPKNLMDLARRLTLDPSRYRQPTTPPVNATDSVEADIVDELGQPIEDEDDDLESYLDAEDEMVDDDEDAVLADTYEF